MKQAARIEWSKQDAEINKLKNRFKKEPEKQEQELARLLAGYRKPRGSTYFKDPETGRTAPTPGAMEGPSTP